MASSANLAGPSGGFGGGAREAGGIKDYDGLLDDLPP